METLYHDPRHPYTRLLFAATPDLYGTGEVTSIPGAPPRLDRELGGLPVPAALRRAARPLRYDHPRCGSSGGHLAAASAGAARRPGGGE